MKVQTSWQSLQKRHHILLPNSTVTVACLSNVTSSTSTISGSEGSIWGHVQHRSRFCTKLRRTCLRLWLRSFFLSWIPYSLQYLGQPEHDYSLDRAAELSLNNSKCFCFCTFRMIIYSKLLRCSLHPRISISLIYSGVSVSVCACVCEGGCVWALKSSRDVPRKAGFFPIEQRCKSYLLVMFSTFAAEKASRDLSCAHLATPMWNDCFSSAPRNNIPQCFMIIFIQNFKCNMSVHLVKWAFQLLGFHARVEVRKTQP